MEVKSAVSKASKVVLQAVGAATNPADQDLLKTLKAEHDEVKALLADLQDADSAALRRSLVRKIKLALVPHTKAEEKILYSSIVAVKDKEVQIDGHEGYIEHELAARTLQKLDGITSATSPEHRAMAKVLKELVEHHIDEEEGSVWRDAKDNFSKEDRVAMNRRYLIAKGQVRIP